MAAVSCGGHYHMLNQVERLLETNPVQADSMLRTIPVRTRKVIMPQWPGTAVDACCHLLTMTARP